MSNGLKREGSGQRSDANMKTRQISRSELMRLETDVPI